jgi:hypothetical protein
MFVLGTMAVVSPRCRTRSRALRAEALTTATGPALATASMTGGALALLPLA